MFLGHHFTRLKDDRRLPVPPHWLRLMSEGAYMTRGFDQNIMLVGMDAFREIYERITSLNIADPQARLLMRMFLSSASYLPPAETETISVPEELFKYAQIQEDVVMVGQGEYVEVWSADLWNEQIEEIENVSENARRFSSFTITTS